MNLRNDEKVNNAISVFVDEIDNIYPEQDLPIEKLTENIRDIIWQFVK